MLRVAHTSDVHLTEGPRFDDTLRCLDAFIDDGIASGVGLWLLGGDMTGTTVPHTASKKERLALAQRISRMGDHGPVVLTQGNHDADSDLLVYGLLDAGHLIHVFEEPAVVDVAGARVFAFPYPFKRKWRAPHLDLPMEEQDRAIEADLRALLASWRVQVEAARAAGMPTIYLGHTAIRDALMAGGERQLPPGHEIELAVGDLIALGCDYSGCGHVHLRQELGAGYGIYIVGSPDRSNFGEETDVKGWNVVDIVPGRPAIVHRRQSPTRLFRTFEATWTCDEAGLWDWRFTTPVDFAALAGAEVRVWRIVPEEAIGTENALRLEKLFRDAHVYSYHPERRVVPKQEIRCPEIVQTESLAEQLQLFWLSEGDAGPDAAQVARCLAKLGDLEHELAEAA